MHNLFISVQRRSAVNQRCGALCRPKHNYAAFIFQTLGSLASNVAIQLNARSL